jgi:putative peptidoglycan lipid II flippase
MANWSGEEIRSNDDRSSDVSGHASGARLDSAPRQPDLWYPAGSDPGSPGDSGGYAARRAAYVDAVDATRFDMPVIPTTAFIDPRSLERLIPPRRGRVQGPGAGITAPTPIGTWYPPSEPAVDEAAPAPEAAPKRDSLLSSSAVMAVATIASRVTGMLRSLIMAAALGTGLLGTNYTVANTVPNIIYFLVIGGALNSVFVPQLVRAMSHDKDGGKAYTDRLLTVTITGLLALTIAAMLAAPLLVDTFTANLSPASYTLTVELARYCLPQIFFYGLFVMFGQILNARDNFGPMMWTSVLNNVVVIATFGAFIWATQGGLRTPGTMTTAETRLLGVGTTLGIVVQTLTLVPYLRSVGIGFRPRFDWRGVGLGKAFALAKWTILFVLVNQIGNMVVTRFATAVDGAHPQEGIGYAAYSQAFTIFGLPQAVVTVSLITAMLPRMARAASEGDVDSVREDVSQGLRVSGVAVVPAALLFIALGPQIAVVLFMHGQVTLTQAHMIGYMLMAFGFALVPFSAQYLMIRGFYAFEDTKTPFTINLWIALLNAVFAIVSYYALNTTRWPVVGMCFGYAIAYAVGTWLTARRLGRKLDGIDGGRVRRTYVRLAAASVPAAVAAAVLGYGINAVAGKAFLGSLAAVIFGSIGMGGVFLMLARRMRISEVDSLLASVRGRVGH